MDNILKHDIWWEAEKCLEYGLVDELIQEAVMRHITEEESFEILKQSDQ